MSRGLGDVYKRQFQAKCLCLFHGQAVVGCISWVKADDILVTFDITMLGVLAILAVCQQTGRCKREIAALKGVEQVRIPQLRLAVLIQKLLSGERVVLVNEVRFDGGIVRVFITIRLFKSLATTSNCMSQICGLWLNNAAALATEAICLSVAIQFTQNFLGVQPECGQVCKFVKEFRPDLLGVCTAGIEVPCKLVEVPTLLHWASRVETAFRVSSPPPATMTVFSILTLWMARRMKVERERFRSLQVSSSDVFSSAVTRNSVSYTHLTLPTNREV